MSESETPKPSPSSSSSHQHHHHHHHNLALYAVGQQQQQQPPPPPPPLSTTTSSSPPPLAQKQQQLLFRDYRKGNWTVQETLTLITAKRLDDERRSRGTSSVMTSCCSPAGSTSTPTSTPRSAEQRWKWVENYCWNNDCLRSQNQCNDKWDNLLRDYKKIRDYQLHNNNNNQQLQQPPSSYWSMERHDRKERNLPTNLSPEVFQALTDVLSRRNTRRSTSTSHSAGEVTPVSSRPPAPPSPASTSKPLTPPPPPPPPPPPAAAAALAPPPPSAAAAAFGAEGSTDTSESEEAEEENEEPDTKRRKLRERRRSLGSSVLRSASELARTLLACEEKREQRHRQMLQLEERRLKMEEERTEANRQALCGLISAVDGLSNAIHDLVSDHLGRHGHAK